MNETMKFSSGWIHKSIRCCRLPENWAGVNSFSDHAEGLEVMIHHLERAFTALGGTMQRVDLSGGGKALHITKRPNVPFKILLGGHMDTVYPPYQAEAAVRKDQRLHGPGVADMKGGLVVMLTALEALEKHPDSAKIGWEVLITPDEEIGSPASKELWQTIGSRVQCALLFEPAFPDGGIVCERRGSANWTLHVTGVGAHVGREFHGKKCDTGIKPLYFRGKSSQ